MQRDEMQSTILIVDDSPEIIDILVAILSPQYITKVALNGRKALELIEGGALPDLILLDVSMPDMNGYELCRKLKADERTEQIPVIFVTGRGEEHEEMMGFDYGAVDYIAKPINPVLVQARVKVHDLLNRQRCELQLAYENLKTMEMLRDSLVHMIVHDLRNPIMGIRGCLDLLARSVERGDEVKTLYFIEKQKAVIAQIETMVSDLLDVSRLEADEMPLDETDFVLMDLVRETIDSCGFATEKIELIAPSTAISVCCDRSLMGRVVANLISNALKFTPQDEVVQVCIEGDGAVVRLSVTDRGPGIPREYHQKIFERFGQVELWRQRSFSSSGLGLTLCKLVIDQHGGRIGVESKEGEGATFWFEVGISG